MANFGNPQGGFQFGTNQNTNANLFGANPAANQPTGLFGTPAANTGFGTPTSNAPNSGLTFGAPASTNTTNLFGTPASSANTMFGAPASAGNTMFGAPANPGNTMFGTPANPGNTMFGTPATAQNKGFGFGTPTAATATTGLSFGSTQASAATTPSLFSTPASSAPTTGLAFGTPASTGGFNLGGTPTANNTGFSLGTTPASGTTPGFSFGTATAVTSTGFSLVPPATTSTGFSLGASPFGGTTTPASTGLSFGLTTPSTGLNFGTSSAPTTTGFSLGVPSTAPPAFNLGGTTTTTTAASVGLGGIASTQPKPGILKNKGQSDVSPKDQPLPNEIMQTVDEFKNYVKQQKTFCSEICRYSIKEFRKVESDIDTANALINDVEKQLQSNRQVAEKLKYDTAKALQHIEMAQRTFDTPPGLQFDNTAPFQFFVELTDNFEREMQALKTQIENTTKYLKNIHKPSQLTSQELSLGMRRLHETFVALAGRLQSVHSQVETQKEQYLNLRKYLLHDDNNVFDKLSKDDQMNVVITTVDYKPPSVVTGPTPFNPSTNPNVAAQSLQMSQLSQGATPGIQPSNMQPLFSSQPNPSNLFGSPSINFGQSFGSTSSNFQLQKPPVGNKRSK